MTEADILQIARAKGDETDTGFIFNKEGAWSVIAFARALLADHAEREAALRAEVERLKAAIDTQPSPPTREDMEWAGKVHLAEAEKENDALRAEVEALRAAIERHRLNIWGDHEVQHPEDVALYAALAAKE